MSNADLQYLYSSCVNENKDQYYGVYSTVISNEPDISNEDSRRKMYDDLKNTFCDTDQSLTFYVCNNRNEMSQIRPSCEILQDGSYRDISEKTIDQNDILAILLLSYARIVKFFGAHIYIISYPLTYTNCNNGLVRLSTERLNSLLRATSVTIHGVEDASVLTTPPDTITHTNNYKPIRIYKHATSFTKNTTDLSVNYNLDLRYNHYRSIRSIIDNSLTGNSDNSSSVSKVDDSVYEKVCKILKTDISKDYIESILDKVNDGQHLSQQESAIYKVYQLSRSN